jgi:4-hydroxy-2-oxoheptanedioate aldolase
MSEIVATCKKYDVVVGHPHVEMENMERVVAEGYRFLMCSAPRSFAKLDKVRSILKTRS